MVIIPKSMKENLYGLKAAGIIKHIHKKQI